MVLFFIIMSPRREVKIMFLKKLLKQCVKYIKKKKKNIFLGDIKSKIDWGYAKDYAESSWKIMQQKKPDFFVIATGQIHSVEYFVKNCFSYIGLDYKKYLKIDKKLLRPSKTSVLRGDITKAKKVFKYKAKTKLKDLIKIMMDHELKKYNE